MRQRGSFVRGGAFSARATGRGHGGAGRTSRAADPADADLLCFGSFVHACEGELVYKAIVPDKVPYFNAPIFLENKAQIGRVEEVFGQLSQVMFSVKPVPGVIPESVRPDDRVYISSNKLLPAAVFTKKGQQGNASGGAKAKQRRPLRTPSTRGGRGGSRPYRGRGGAMSTRGAGFRRPSSSFSGGGGGISKRPYRR